MLGLETTVGAVMKEDLLEEELLAVLRRIRRRCRAYSLGAAS